MSITLKSLAAFLQCDPVIGKSSIYHKIAAAETIWIFDLVKKGCDPFLFG